MGAGLMLAPPFPILQADAALSQLNPISGDKYLVLDTTHNCRIITIHAKVTWTVQPDPLEIHVTIDGVTIIFSAANPASATNFDARWVSNAAMNAQLLVNATDYISRAFLLEGKSIKIEAETTGGTVSNLTSRIKYAKYL